MTRALHVSFTGTQEGMTAKQREGVETSLRAWWQKGARYFHHGDCVGADAEAHTIAQRLRYRVILHPCTIFGKRAYSPSPFQQRMACGPLQRNWDIAREGDVLLAAPKQRSEVMRSGTWSTVRRARKLGRPIEVFEP